MAEAIRDGLRLEAIAADIAGDGDAALVLLNVNTYDIAVLDRDIPGPNGDENRRAHRRLRQRHADPHAYRCRPSRRQGHRVRARRRRLPDEAVRAPRARAPAESARPQARTLAATGARDRRPPAGPVPPRGLPRRPLRRADQEAVRSARGHRRRGGRHRQHRVSWPEHGTRTPTRSPTRCASRSRDFANDSASRGSSRPWPESGIASTQEQSVARAPG